MSLEPTAFFRCEASPRRGAGHAVRCSVLADALVEKGWDCTFVTSRVTDEFIPTLTRFKNISPDQFWSDTLTFDLLVVDSYDLDASYESHFRPYAKKIMVIDDFADRKHDCDILLNQNFGFAASDYQHLISEQCKLLLGVEHCMVSSSFYQHSRKRDCFNNILFYMGGSGNIQQISRLAIDCSKEYKVGFVEGFVNNSKETTGHDLGVSFPANQIQQAYNWSDISIGFAGQGMFERYVMGIPMLIFSQNEMQHSVLNRIQDTNIIYCGDIKDISFQLVSKKLNQLKEGYRYTKHVPNLAFLTEFLN